MKRKRVSKKINARMVVTGPDQEKLDIKGLIRISRNNEYAGGMKRRFGSDGEQVD